MATLLGLKLIFVHYFSPDIHGKLLVRERRILINAHKPRCEHIFTMLHEFGHFLLHFKKPQRKHHPRIFDVRLPFEFWAVLSSIMRRYFRYIFNKQSGKEWEADLWAMFAFIYLTKKGKGRQEFMAFMDRHPEKMGMLFLAAGGIICYEAKKRILVALQTLGNSVPLVGSFRRSWFAP